MEGTCLNECFTKSKSDPWAEWTLLAGRTKRFSISSKSQLRHKNMSFFCVQFVAKMHGVILPDNTDQTWSKREARSKWLSQCCNNWTMRTWELKPNKCLWQNKKRIEKEKVLWWFKVQGIVIVGDLVWSKRWWKTKWIFFALNLIKILNTLAQNKNKQNKANKKFRTMCVKKVETREKHERRWASCDKK